MSYDNRKRKERDINLSVAAAAEELRVSRQRVLAMINAGRLPATRVGKVWVVRSEDVDLLKNFSPIGKPMSGRNAWGLLALIDGGHAPWLGYVERHRLRKRIEQVPAISKVANWVRMRNDEVCLRGHSAAIPRLLERDFVLPTGASAPGQDLIDLRKVEVYMPNSELEAVKSQLMLREVNRADANIVAKLPRGLWPFDSSVWPVAIAIDLWEAADERSRRSAKQLFKTSSRYSANA